MPLRIMIDGAVRDMTPEEERRFLESVEDDDATESDYIDALQDLGVNLNDEE